MSAAGLAPLAGRFAIGSRPALRFWRGGLPSVRARPSVSVAAFALGSRLALRLYRCVLPQFMPGLATLARLLPSVRARPYGSGGAVCARFARGLPFLSRHLSSVRAPGDAMSVPSLLFLSQRLRSVHAFGLAVLAGVVLGSRAALRFYCGVLPRFTPAVCRLAPNRTACGILRSCSAGSRSPFVRSRDVGAVICLCGFTSGLAVSLWRSRRVAGDAGYGRTGAGGAAFVRLCAVTSALQCFPRGVRWGCAPQTAPKSLRLSGLSSWG